MRTAKILVGVGFRYRSVFVDSSTESVLVVTMEAEAPVWGPPMVMVVVSNAVFLFWGMHSLQTVGLHV